MQRPPHQLPQLTPHQLETFKREGFVILPAALDLELCRQSHAACWDTIEAHVPRMKRGDPATWVPITEEETAAAVALSSAKNGGGPASSGFGGQAISLHDGAEERVLDLFPRAIFGVAEQLLGAGTVTWPAGADENGMTHGPQFMDDGGVYGQVAYREGAASLGGGLMTDEERETGVVMGWPLGGTFQTVPQMEVPRYGPVWSTGQGTRGMIIRLPNTPPIPEGDMGAHSDGACYNRWRLQATAYIADVPPKSGAFTVFPRSHGPIWREQPSARLSICHSAAPPIYPYWNTY